MAKWVSNDVKEIKHTFKQRQNEISNSRFYWNSNVADIIRTLQSLIELTHR